MIVRDLMTSKPISVNVETKIGAVLGVLNEVDVRHVPVLDQGELVGIVSDRDLRTIGWPPVGDLETMEKLGDKLQEPVSTLMSSDVLSVGPDSEVSEVVDLMLENRIGAVPVVDPVNGELVGILSYVDLLRGLRDVWAE